MAWDNISPAEITGWGGSQVDRGSGGVATGVESSVVTQETSDAPPYSPDSPLFWFAVLLALAGGSIYVVHHVRVGANAHAGPAHAEIEV